MIPVTVGIPKGEQCVYTAAKPCIFARYTRKWNAYNCTIYHRILKGGQCPRKCPECIEYCGRERRNANGQDQD